MNPDLCDPSGKYLLTFRFNVKAAERSYQGIIPSQDLEIFLTNVTGDDHADDDDVNDKSNDVAKLERDDGVFQLRMKLFTEVFYNQLTMRNCHASESSMSQCLPGQVIRDVAAVIAAHYSQISLLYFEWKQEPFQKAFMSAFRKTEELFSKRRNNKRPKVSNDSLQISSQNREYDGYDEEDDDYVPRKALKISYKERQKNLEEVSH